MTECYIRARVVHFDCDQDFASGLRYLPDAILAIADGRIQKVDHAEAMFAQGLDASKVIDKQPCLIMPGFIDSHVHAPQQEMIGAYGEQLLDWLNKYTFPTEIKYKDPIYSRIQSEYFVDDLLRQGTTTAFVFTTSFANNTRDIFNAFNRRNMRAVAGKVLMDRHAPDALLDSATWYEDTQTLIDDFHGKGRLGYALTPRFSITSSDEQLQACGELVNYCDDLWVQTHLSENLAEIQSVKSLFPSAKHYLDTYDAVGLHTSKTIYGHCVHLEKDEYRRMAEVGSSVAFCPSSNLFLGSGALDLKQSHSHDIPCSIASDVGAGTSLSMFQVLGDAYKVSQLAGYSLSAKEAFYSCTLGSAKAIHLDHVIGNFATGKEADFIVVDPSQSEKVEKRLQTCSNIDEELFVYMTMGDERLIKETYILGELAFENF